MIIKIDDKAGNMIINALLKLNEIIDYKVYDTVFECFLDSELKECSDVCQDTLGEHTLKQISKEVEEYLMNEEIDIVSSCYIDVVSSCYFEKVQEYSKILDNPTIGYYTISNNIVVNLKEIFDDEIICTYGNDVYKSEIVIDEEDNDCVKIGELLIPLKDFMRV